MASAVLFPPVIVGPFLVAGAAAAADAVAYGVRRSQENQRLKEEAEANARRLREAKKHAEEIEKKRKEEEAHRPKPAQIRANLRRLHEEILREIDADTTLDEAEKFAARERAKQNYLHRLGEVL